MGNSSLLGIDKAPTRAPGADSDALGPSDSSDSGSDLVGVAEEEAGETLPEREAPDISVDRVVGPGEADTGEDEDEDEDPDLGFMDEAQAGDTRGGGTGEDGSEAEDGEDGEAGDPTDGPLAGVRDPG